MNIYHSLLFNIILNFAIITFTFLIIEKLEKRKYWAKIFHGSLFGFASLLTMSFPVVLQEGFAIDSRTIFINLSTLLFGKTAGFITTSFAIVYGLYGENNVVENTLLALFAYAISLGFYVLLKKRKGNLLCYVYSASLLTHIIMLVLMSIIIKGVAAGEEEKKLILPILIIYPVLTTFFAYLIIQFKKWRKSYEELEIEKRFSDTILNNVSEIIIATDLRNRITYVNKKAKVFFNENNLIGKNILEVLKIFNEYDNEMTEQLLEKAKQGETAKFSKCKIAKGIKKIPGEGTVSCLFDNKKKPIAILYTLLDTTEKTEKETLLSNIIERISDGIESFDKNWNYTFANNKAAKLLNKKSPKELIGKNKWKVDPEVVGTPFYKACKKAQQEQKPMFMEHYYKPWGKWFENRIYPSKEGITIFFTDITEKKKLEKELQALNENLNNIFKLNPAIIYAWDPETRKTLFISENIEKVLGYTREETYENKWWRRVVHPADIEEAILKSDRVYVDGSSTQKFRLYKKDGSIAWILERQILIRDKNGKPEKIFGVWLDITEITEMEEKLQTEEKRFEKLFHNNAIPMLLIEKATMKIIDANPAACDVYGYEPEQFKEELTVVDLHPEGTEVNEVKQLPDHSYYLETTHVTADGKKLFVEIYGIPIQHKDKEYLFAIIHDITKKKELEKSLIESEARFYLAFQTIPIPFSITRVKDGKIIEVNEAFEKVAKVPRKELIGKTTIELGFWQDKEERENFIKYLKKYKQIKNKEILFLNRKKQKVDTLFSATLIKDEKTKEELFIASFLDITELKQLQNELEIKVRERTAMYEELNETLKEFAHSLAHDLIEPVRTLKNYSELLLHEDKKILNEKKKEYLKFINLSSEKLEKMIKDLLNYAIIGRETVTMGKVPLDRVLSDVLRHLEDKIEKHKAEIEIDNDLPVVYGNEVLLLKVFQNLIDNAIKFSKPNTTPKIKITCSKKKGLHIISVKDNGIGIDKENIKKIFFPFQKGHYEEETEGTGIGLAIVKKSLEVMRGKIEVKSTGNKGTVFVVKLKD